MGRIWFTFILTASSWAAPVHTSNPSERNFRLQETSDWCWAASAQNVLSDLGISSTQPEIVSKVYGRPIVRGIYSPTHLQPVLSSYGVESAFIQNLSLESLKQAFDSGKKVISFVSPVWASCDHVVVFQRLTPDGRVVVSDPLVRGSHAYTLDELRQNWRWHTSLAVSGRGTRQNTSVPQRSEEGAAASPADSFPRDATATSASRQPHIPMDMPTSTPSKSSVFQRRPVVGRFRQPIRTRMVQNNFRRFPICPVCGRRHPVVARNTFRPQRRFVRTGSRFPLRTRSRFRMRQR